MADIINIRLVYATPMGHASQHKACIGPDVNIERRKTQSKMLVVNLMLVFKSSFLICCSLLATDFTEENSQAAGI